MVARVGGVDRNDGQVAQVLPVGAQRCSCNLVRLGNRLLAKAVRNAMFMNGDQAERARRKRIAEHFGDAHDNTWWPTRFFGEHKVSLLCIAQVSDYCVVAFTLVDRLQEMTFALAAHDTQQQFLPTRQFLHWVDDMPCPALFRPAEKPIANAECRSLPALDDAQSWRRHPFRLPVIGRRDHAIAIDIHHAHHRDLGNPAHLVERTTRSAVDQPFVGHVFEQGFQRDLVVAVKPKGLGDLALSCRHFARGDEGEDLVAVGQAVGKTFWHKLR